MLLHSNSNCIVIVPFGKNIQLQIIKMIQLVHMLCLIYSNDFATYAETCFQKFGDRVKHWITFNEPHTFTIQGYDVGLQAPGRCSILLHLFCRAGNSATEPYIVAHNALLTHAKVADIYRKKYKVKFSMLMLKLRGVTSPTIFIMLKLNNWSWNQDLTWLVLNPYRQNRVDHLGQRLMLFGMNLHQTPQKTLKQLKEPKISNLAGKYNYTFIFLICQEFPETNTKV